MNDAQQEKVYFTIALAVVLLSPLTVITSLNAPNYTLMNDFAVLWTAIAVVAALLVVFALDFTVSALQQGSVKGLLWVVNPSMTLKRKATLESVADVFLDMQDRLRQIGCVVEVQEGTQLTFEKQPVPMDESFIGATRLKGSVRSEIENGEAVIVCDLLVEDTILVPNSEKVIMKSFCEYVLGQTQSFAHRTFPLTMGITIWICVFQSAALWMNSKMFAPTFSNILLGIGWMPAALSIYGIYVSFKKSDVFRGRAASVVCFLASMPIIVVWVLHRY